MRDEERNIRKRLKDDFVHYASKCLKISPKDGYLQNFKLNKAQLYINNLVEKQKRETGKIRAIILKGRQQGCCFSPDMRVLTSDYRWKILDEVKVGERLVACDEESLGTTSTGKKKSRKFRTSIVEFKKEFFKQTYEVLFDNGCRLNVTPDHRMLSKKRGGDEQVWRYVSDFKIGDNVRIATRPPTYLCETYEDGWLAGIIDGEGSARISGTKRISIHQFDGPILNRIKDYFNNADIPYKEVIDSRQAGSSSKLGNKSVHRLDIHRLPYIMELFSRCRPTRFTNDEWHVGHELPGKSAQDGISAWTKVISIKPLERQRVIDLQTSTKTFICEGLVSHNSTYIEGRLYWLVTHNFGIRAFILTHAIDATNNLFKMAQRYHEHCPEVVRPTIQASNAKELIFASLDSGYKIGTAGNKFVGRSSTIQLLHASEVAFWANASEHAKGILQAVPDAKNTEIFIESTANGLGNYFHEQWQLAETGESEFIPIFVPWFWQDEYNRHADPDFKATEYEEQLIECYRLTPSQLSWRRYRIMGLSIGGLDGTRAFMQEYPCNSTEAFQNTGEDNFIDTSIAMAARKMVCETSGNLVIGVDPARFGDDRTSIIRRKGRVAYNIESYIKKDTMEVAGLVHRIIIEENPSKVCIDIGGLGAGVFDRLKELGHSDVIVSVNGGSSPLDAKRYFNKRAEMWGQMKVWLMDFPCQIPDNDTLHADLCSIKYKFDSNTRLQLERKEDMKRRGIRSPDEADALALTFACPDPSLTETRAKQYSNIAKTLVGAANNLDRLKKAAYGR